MQENDLKNRVNFEIIRYANCWEDADVLLEGLALEPQSKVLSIGSAGDNSFSLLATQPALVVAIDINPVQLHLIALKKACFQTLNRAEMLAFLGFSACEGRQDLFRRVQTALDGQARAFWQARWELLERGVIYEGKFERYFRFFARKILPFIHRTKTIEELLAYKTDDEQASFYRKRWNTWRWRLFFSIFFSKFVMGKYGRDPEFMKWVKVPVSQYIYDKAARHLQSAEAQNNFILRFNLTGTFGDLLPHYLREENFEKIQQNIDRLHIMEGYAQDAIQQFGAFDAMNLSNIFEYMDAKLFEQTAEALLQGLSPAGKLAYWNLMVPRQISTLFPHRVTYLKTLSERLTAKDKGFFYNHFFVEAFQ